MRALTVRQPWAWAIIHGGKDVENRTRNIVGSYRGRVAIHAGLAPFEKHNLASQAAAAAHGTEVPTEMKFGAFIGLVDLIDVHEARLETSAFADVYQAACCSSPWAVMCWLDSSDPVHHLVLANPRPLHVPIPARGRLGLWTPEPAAGEQLEAVV